MNEQDSIEKSSEELNIIPVIDQVRVSIEQGIPLEEDKKDLLNRFNEYDLAKEIDRRGKENILSEIKISQDLFEKEKFQSLISEGIEIAQSIYPQTKIQKFPIYIIYAGRVTDARAMEDGFVLNLGNITSKSKSGIELFDFVKSITAHETTHRFLDQLGIAPESSDTVKDKILNTLWEEGLTTTMQTEQYPWHQEFINDSEFWFGVIKEWIGNVKSEDEKKEIIERCLNRESCKNWMGRMGEWFKGRIFATDSTDEIFIRLLQRGNGPLYHLGYMLWKKQLDSGKEISELVSKGHSQAENWLNTF